MHQKAQTMVYTVIWALPLSNHDAGTNTKSKSKGRSRGRRQRGFGLVTDVSWAQVCFFIFTLIFAHIIY